MALLYYLSEFLLHLQEGPTPSNIATTCPLPSGVSNEHFTKHSAQLSSIYYNLKFSLRIAQGYIASKWEMGLQIRSL